MTKPKGILFFDIDGTLLNSENKLTERTKSALINIYNKGYKVALASGRCIDGLRIVREQIPIPIIQITMNGAYNVADDGSLICESTIETETSKKVKNLMNKHNLQLLYFSENKWFTEYKNELYNYEISVVKYDGTVCPLIDIVDKIKIHKLLAYGTPTTTKEFIAESKRIFPELNIVSSSSFYVEINKSDADKGKGIISVAEHYGVNISDTFVFGDYDNDIAGFKVAGNKIAMANASENLLKLADVVTLSNDEDGVAYYIEQNLLN